MSQPAPPLDRLVLNLSQRCNCRCRYCYAQGGTYGGEPTAMSPETARTALDWFMTHTAGIKRVQLFGGEPLLEMDLLEECCRLTGELAQRHEMEPPQLAVVTNGTLIDARFLEAVARWDLTVVVSLDGPAPLHDSLRPLARGGGSFEAAVAGIAALKAATGQPAQVEGTFTNLHLAGDFDLAGFMDILAVEHSVQLLHMPWILGGSSELAIEPTLENLARLEETYTQAVETSLDRLLAPDLAATTMLSLAHRQVQRILDRREPQDRVCPAGCETLAVAADGTIYPCFMFVGQAGMALGRVGETPPAQAFAAGEAFAASLALPPNDAAPSALAACAGQNWLRSGDPAVLSPDELAILRRLAARVDDRLAWANHEDLKAKMMLYTLLLSAPE